MAKQKPPSKRPKVSKYQLPPRPVRYAKLPQSPFWPTLIEKLLLAIIDAHPIEYLDESGEPLRDKRGDLVDGRQVRLASALKALTGYSRGSGAPSLFDFQILMQVVHERLGSDLGAESARWLFPDEEPIKPHQFSSHFRPKSGRRQLDKKRHAQLTRLKRKYESAGFREYAGSLYPDFENEEESDLLRDLEQIAQIFARWNTPIQVDAKRLGMGSKTHNFRLYKVRR